MSSTTKSKAYKHYNSRKQTTPWNKFYILWYIIRLHWTI